MSSWIRLKKIYHENFLIWLYSVEQFVSNSMTWVIWTLMWILKTALQTSRNDTNRALDKYHFIFFRLKCFKTFKATAMFPHHHNHLLIIAHLFKHYIASLNKHFNSKLFGKNFSYIIYRYLRISWYLISKYSLLYKAHNLSILIVWLWYRESTKWMNSLAQQANEIKHACPTNCPLVTFS